MKKILLSSAVVTGLLASSVFAGGGAAWAVAPATPYTLAATDSLYIIDTEGSGIYETTASGEMTLLDLQLNPSTDGFFPAGALNPLDNKVYLVYVDQTGDDLCYLDQVDPLGGAPAARVHVQGAEEPFDCFGLNIDAAGNALIYGEWDNSGPWLDSVWKVNLATGALSDRVDIDTSLYGFTVSPDGQWYGLHDDGTLVQIDSTTGSSTLIVATTLDDVYDAKFDSQGTLWFTDNENSNVPPYQLYGWRAGDTDYTLQGDTSIGGDSSVGLFGPTFVGKSTVTIAEEAQDPQLSNTGLNQSVVVSAAIAGVGLVVVGLLSLMLIRRRRHS